MSQIPTIVAFVMAMFVAQTGSPTQPLSQPVVTERQVDPDMPLILLVTNVNRERAEDGSDLVEVEGRIVNPTDRILPLFPIEAEALARDGSTVHRWTFPPPVAALQAQASVPFQTAERGVPASARELRLTIGSSPAKPEIKSLTLEHVAKSHGRSVLFR